MKRLLALLAPAVVLAAPTVDATLDDDRDLVVRVTNAPLVDPSSILLRVDNEPGVSPESAISHGRIAIGFVLFTQEIWIGNDEHESDENARFSGVFPALADGFDRVIRSFTAPAGSTITVITYAEEVAVRVPETQLATLPLGTLGTQRDYLGRSGSQLVRGVERGILELERSTAPIKHLIIVGDGNDANNELATVRLHELAERAVARRIKLHLINLRLAIHRPDQPPNGAGFDGLEPTMFAAHRVAEAEARLQDILDSIRGHIALEFPPSALRFDGRVHAMELDFATEQVRFRFEMPDERPMPPTEARTPRVLVAALVAGAVLLVVLTGVSVRARRARR